MTNIVCLLYVGWITNYVAKSGPKVAESDGGGAADRKLEEDSKGETLKIIERLDRLESVVNEHIKGQNRSSQSLIHVSNEFYFSFSLELQNPNELQPSTCFTSCSMNVC